VGPYPNVLLPCFKPNFKAAQFHKHAFTLCKQLGEVGSGYVKRTSLKGPKMVSVIS
jgi:hypothetical protein